MQKQHFPASPLHRRSLLTAGLGALTTLAATAQGADSTGQTGNATMDGKLPLTLACMPSDRTMAFFTREVEIDGVSLSPIAMNEPAAIFRAMVQDRAFGLAEMSLGQCFEQAAANKPPFVALPIFLSRSFRHSFVFINRNSGIRRPEDLAGRRIGVQHHGMSAAVWIRSALRSEFGVDFSRVTWVEGAVNALGHGFKVSGASRGAGLTIQTVTDRTLSDMLADGSIDAMIGAWVPDSFGKSADVVRLFDDSRTAEKRFYARTGIFPIMHALVLRSDLHQTDPGLAARVFDAFNRAKAIAMDHHRSSGALSTMLPWLPQHLEETEQVFGADCWPYGLEANKTTLTAFAEGLLADGAIAKVPALDSVFLPFG